jgi:hypothetical protein
MMAYMENSSGHPALDDPKTLTHAAVFGYNPA